MNTPNFSVKFLQVFQTAFMHNFFVRKSANTNPGFILGIFAAVFMLQTGSAAIAATASEPAAATAATSACTGSTELPAHFKDAFTPSEDDALLNKALGAPDKGGLCQGKVYELKQGVVLTLYRAWNSTNPGSRLGNWWAFEKPSGKVAQYRTDYEICYQWSPLDKMTLCRLNAGSKVVVGTGQSAYCSQYLTYPTSASQQIYIENASSAVSECRDYDAKFKWRLAPQASGQ